MYTRIIDVTH